MTSQTPSVAVYQIPEEIQQLALVITILRFLFNVLADVLDQIKDLDLVVKHGFVVIVHLLQEVNATHVPLYVVDHLGNVPLHLSLDLVEVLDKGNYEVVAHVQQF